MSYLNTMSSNKNQADVSVVSMVTYCYLAFTILAISAPRQCGRGRVHRKCRLTGLKALTVPSEQPQKINSSVTDRQVA